MESIRSFFMILKISFLLLTVILFFGCSKKIQSKVYFNELKIDSSENNLLNPESINHLINPGFVDHKSKKYFYYLDTAYSLQFLNPLNVNDTFSIKLFTQKNIYRDNLFFINGSKINLLNIRKLLFTSFSYSKSGSFQEQNSINLNKYFNNKNLFVYTNHLNPCYIDSNYLYLPYFKSQYFKNFPLKHVYKKIPLDGVGELQDIFTYPNEIISKKRFSATSQCIPITDSTLACFFTESDRVELYNKNNHQIVLNKNFTPYSNFEDFDNDKNDDLSYVRFYNTNNEYNFVFAFDKKVFILKKLRSKSQQNSFQYDYYILDSELTIKHFGKIVNSIHPIIIPIPNGFAIFSGDYKKIYRYHY